MTIMPKQVPHASEQRVGTPRLFLDAVEARVGPLTIDLCASRENACAPAYLTEATDSLKADWSGIRGAAWCNPPYRHIEPWVRKAASTTLRPGAKIAMLTPASVGSNWFRDHVYGHARVYFLCGRIRFVGHTQAYPKDLMLSVYGELPSLEIWTWSARRLRKAGQASSSTVQEIACR